MREVLKVYGPAILLIVVIFVVAIRFIAPPPPHELRLLAGAPGGYYHSLAERYRDLLAEDGIDVVVEDSHGSIDNLHRLIDQPEGVDVALVQGGLASEVSSADNLVAIAGLFYEPVWVVVRRGLRIRRLADLKGRRIAIGTEGSGTRVLARQLLLANEIDANDATLLEVGTGASLAGLEAGTIDAAFIVIAEPSQPMVDVLERKKVRLLSFDQADAYRMKFPFLTPVRLPMGAVSLPDNVPPTNVTLMAPTAMLVARDDIHPALVNLLLRAASQLHGGRQLFAPAGTFPTRMQVDFPLQSDAEHYFVRGPSLLFRYLPFWIAVWIERMIVLAIPLLTLLPIIRIAPPAYRWQVERKIYRWYKRLRYLEAEADTVTDPGQRAKLRSELDEIQARLLKLKVPISYAKQLYDLRLHVDFVRARLS